jgi:hypothetical protein
MLIDVFKFELAYHRRQYLFYILSGVFFLLAFLGTTTPNVFLVSGVGNVNINSPYTVVATLTSLSLFSVIGAIAFCANGVTRDYELMTAELFLSSPISKFAYLYGRFSGALVFSIGLYLAGALGVFIGEFMPWLDQERIGATRLDAFWFVTWAIAVPNILICAGMFFCIATITRSTMATYVALIGLIILNAVVSSFTEKDMIELTSMLDPFGATAFQELTRYWTVFEKNELVPALEGTLLLNRVVWLFVGLGFLAAAYPLYKFSLESGRKKKKETLEVADERIGVQSTVHHKFSADFSLQGHLAALFSQTMLEFRNIVFSAPFVVLLLFGLLSVTGNAIASLGNIFGTAVYPTTSIIVNMINGAFSISLLAVLIYYSGELLAREKAVRVNEIMDAMPHPNWVIMVAKFAGIFLVLVAMLLSAMLAGLGVQIYKEYYYFNISQYLVGLLFFFQFPLYFMAVLAVFFYVLLRNKYLAMFMMILYFVASLAAPQLGFENYLYRFRQLGVPYSDFTGYTHNLIPYLWQTFYWSLFGLLMLIAIHLLWPRGTEDDWANKLRVARQRFSPTLAISAVIVLLAFVSTGGWIFYNTNVLNDYVTNRDLQKLAADFEKKYKQYETVAQPAVTRVYAEVDIYPEERDVIVKGSYDLTNLTNELIENFYVSSFPYLEFKELTVPGAQLVSHDEELGFRIFKLEEPMEPGAVLPLTFESHWLTPGFANNGHGVKVTSNGTFFNNLDAFPVIGYVDNFELNDNSDRRRYELPPLERMRKIDDEAAHLSTFAGQTRTEFEVVVSTSSDQIAIAPGYLQAEWEEDARKYFHYKMDKPIWGFFSFTSGRYELLKDSWNDEVAIEVYYLHDHNIETMVRSVKNSLDYFTTNFSPYQYRQFRIIEFPRYQGAFAQSFPNTIPFSEAIGFTADLRDPEKIDYVYYVTAHELAHQWWAHQVLGADAQGQSMIVETLAQYFALMVMEKEYGSHFMKRFLEYELDRYLGDRGGELIDELPLFLVENQQYIHYRKGSVVLYALKDYIGEENLNRALKNFIQDYAFKGAPYPTTRHLIAYIRDNAAEEHQSHITDLLERIVLFDLKAKDPEIEALNDGRYKVSFDVAAHKYEADGSGAEVEVPIASWIDIGVFGAEQGEAKVPEVLFLEKRQINGNSQSFSIVVDSRPRSVGIDPFNKLIDRNPSDNIVPIREKVRLDM